MYVCMVLANPHQLYDHYDTGRVGQNRIYTPYMAVYLVIPLPKIPYMHRIYMVLTNSIYRMLLYGIEGPISQWH
jgi:negative regulator of sigma E activity